MQRKPRPSNQGSLVQLADAASIADLAQLARRRVPRFAFDYVDGGAGEDAGVRRNQAAFERVLFQPRRLTGSPLPPKVTLLGRTYDQPFGIAPVGLANVTWPGTDLALAGLARRANIPYALSTFATTDIERAGAAAGEGGWFQLYVARDDVITDDLLARAWAAGFRVLVFTVDVPAPSRRNRSIRNRLDIPLRWSPQLVLDCATHPRWALATVRAGQPTLANYTKYTGSGDLNAAGRFATRWNKYGLDWSDLTRLRGRWQGGFVVKGILAPEDARLAVSHGADAVWVSNHGGRQLEAAPASLEVLPQVRAALPRSVPVLFDSGVRGGEDIVKALALGADMVLCGRAFMYGAGAGGAAGIAKAHEILSAEVAAALAQIGVASMADLGRHVQWSQPPEFASGPAPEQTATFQPQIRSQADLGQPVRKDAT